MSDVQYRLRSPALLRTLMQHTGTGDRVTIRDLAKHAGVHSSTIGEIVKGDQERTNSRTAEAIANRIGVDLLILWSPAQRADAAIAFEAEAA